MRFCLLILFVLGGCGTSQREALRAYREAFVLGDYAKAGELLKKAELEKDPKVKLLILMEKGKLNYAQGNFKEAAQHFTSAIELSDQQYTKSVTREGSKWVVNDASGEFFGSPYERSWLFYYQAMANWRIYQEGILPEEQARIHLFAARAALLGWDSFFQDWQRSTGGKTLYRHDLVAKLVAAEVHEATQIRADKQIALQLYKDGWKIFTTLTPAYGAFNKDAKEYSELLQKSLQATGDFKAPSKHKELNPLAQPTRQYILEKIVQLTLDLRPNELTQLPAQLGISSQDLAEAKKGELGNVSFVLEEGVMAPKSSEEINLGIQGLAKLSNDPKTQAQIARMGSEVMAAFAVNMLGMTPRPSATTGNYVAAQGLMTLAAHEAAIAFEVPMIPKGESPQEMWLIIRDKNQKEVAKKPWGVVTHLEDVARQSLEEESGQRIVRTGVRVAMKHITAIVAAMAIYNNISKGEKENMFAKLAAVGSYVAATKGIAYSERADTRAWQTLPRSLRMTEFKLLPGEYIVELSKKTEQNTWELKKALGAIKVGQKRAIFTYLIPQL